MKITRVFEKGTRALETHGGSLVTIHQPRSGE